MSYAALEREYAGFYAPTFRLLFGGTTGGASDYRFDDGSPEVREAHGLVSGLSVESTLDGASRFSFTLVGVYDLETTAFDAAVLDRFAPGRAVRIEVGYRSTLVPLLDGRIQSLRPEFPASGAPSVEVSGYDRLHDMAAPTRDRDWSNERLAKVVGDVVEPYGFDPGRRRIDPLLLASGFAKVDQDNQSDLTFLNGWAERYNRELFVRLVPDPTGGTGTPADADGTAGEPERGRYVPEFDFRSPDDDADPSLTLRYGESLRSFSVEVNEADQPSSVTVKHWDGRRRRRITGSYPERTDDGRDVSVPVESTEQAELAAQAAYERAREGRVTGRGELVGLPTLRPGGVIRLERLSGAVDGNYYVTGVTHRVDESGYATTIDVRLARDETVQLTSTST